MPERLKADGLQRSFAVAGFSAFFLGPPPYGVLREFLEDLPPPLPEILFVDGLEHWVDADPDTIQALNLGRERLANLGVVVVFLLPAYVIDLIRTHALNLWSWRAHYYTLGAEKDDSSSLLPLSAMNLARVITPGDTPEARDRRIRILQRLLDEGLSENRSLESLLRSVTLPLARELTDAGRFAEALSLLDPITQLLEKGKDSQLKAALLKMRASILEGLGLFGEAIRFLEKAMEIEEKLLGQDHPELAHNLNNLSALHFSLGHYRQAEVLLAKTLATEEKTLGPDHPSIAATLNNLATLCFHQGLSLQAEQLSRRALTIQEKALGKDHPNVATSLTNLSVFYTAQGRYTEAIALGERALSIWKQTLGAEHPHAAHSLYNLGRLHELQGEYEQAEILYKRALSLQEKALGLEHPDIAFTLNNLGGLSATLGDYAKAERFWSRALTIKEKMLGPDHPSVAQGLENYAFILRQMHRAAQAAKLEARAQAIRAKHARESPTP